MQKDPRERSRHVLSPGRRAVLRAGLGLLLGLNVCRAARVAAADPAVSRPRPGDRFVFADGDRKGALIEMDDLSLDGPQVVAFPIDPATGTVRDGSRLNKALLIRFDLSELAEETRARSAEGVVAYSGICTHQGCDVAAWQEETKTFWCPCHDSKFDPRDGARVVGGPAPKRLAALPITLVDGVPTVAGGFAGPVGPQTR